MYSCLCQTISGLQKEKAYSVTDYHYNFNINERKNKKYSVFMTFDIETSRYRKSFDEYESFMYQWQICIDDDVIFGKTWYDLDFFLKKITSRVKKTVVIYVHNLAYEFQFMKAFFNFHSIFSIDEHAIIKCLTEDKAFEFRCSYKLSNMNLEKFIENTPNHYYIKAKGDLDYSKLRTPKTELSDIEYGYCYNDVKGLYHSINHLLEEDTLDTIPLTSTGYVRRECRKAMRNKEDRKIFNNSKIKKYSLYEKLKKAFRGGNTASSRYMTNVILENVHSFDISSSYPYVMMIEKYPIGQFMKASIESLEEVTYYNHYYCTLGKYHFKNLKIKENIPIPYISFSKCEKINRNAIVYNGRVLECEYASMYITNIDFEIIDNMYDYDELYIDDFYYARKKLLPKSIRKVILNYFKDKTRLKGVEEAYYFYMKQKNKLNSIYGMTVSNIVRDEYFFNSEKFIIEKKEMNIDDMQKSLEKYNSSRNSFLCYAWGVWVTAYARKRLQKLIDIIGLDTVYVDTDSVKFIGSYNNEIAELNKEVYSLKTDIPIYAKDKKGNEIYLGIWDKEKPYDRFITLGAKKYAYEQNGKIGVTVSGLSKVNAPIELKEKGGLEYFRKGEVFHNSGRKTVEYVHSKRHTLNVNGEIIENGSYINMFDTTYTLGISDTMLDIIDNSKLM